MPNVIFGGETFIRVNTDAAVNAHNEAVLSLGGGQPPLYFVVDNAQLNLSVTTDVGRSLGNVPYLTILGDDITNNQLTGRFFYGSCSSSGIDVVTYVRNLNALDPGGALATLGLTMPPNKQYTIKIYIHRMVLGLVSSPVKHGTISLQYYAMDYASMGLGGSAASRSGSSTSNSSSSGSSSSGSSSDSSSASTSDQSATVQVLNDNNEVVSISKEQYEKEKNYPKDHRDWSVVVPQTRFV